MLLVVVAVVLVALCLPLSLSAQITETFTSNGTFTVPAGVTEITVQAWGAGGGGADNGGNNGGGGGGGGAYAQATFTVLPGNNYSVIVGVGGGQATNGGNSYFDTGANVLAAGGSAGNNTVGGAGGLASNSVASGLSALKYSGGSGGSAANGGGGGGGSAFENNDGGIGSDGSGNNGGAGGTGSGTGGTGGDRNNIGDDGNNPGGGGGGSGRGVSGNSGGSGADGLVIISYTPTDPTLSVDPSSIDFGNVASGSTDTQTFTLTGSNLDGTDVTITGSSDFQVSTDGTTFSNSVTISGYGTSLSQDIYVQFAPTSSNQTYNDNVVNAGGGATAENVNVTGNSNLSYCSSAGNLNFDTGITLVDFGTITNPTSSNKTDGYNDFTAQSTDVTKGMLYNLSVNVNSDGAYEVYVRAWIDWNQDGDFDDAGEEKDLGFGYNVTDGPTNLSPISIIVPSTAIVGSTLMRVSVEYDQYPTSCANNFDGEVEDYSVNVQEPSSPVLTADPVALEFGNIQSGNTSTDQTFDLSGLALTGSPGNITITAPIDFEVSLTSGSGFGSSVIVPFSSPTLNSTAVYVRFAPTTPVTFYDDNITISGGGGNASVNVTGNSDIYCTAEGNINYNTGITLVNIGSIYNSTPSDKTEGYTMFTGLSTNLELGSNYNLTVNVNTDGPFTAYAMAWIDWNQDDDFNDAGEEFNLGNAFDVSDGATSNSPLSITVPAGATPGNVRMRVVAQYNQQPTACQTGFDGEVEDYSLNILPPVSITTDPISPLSYCPGASVSVSYSITGTFNAGNVFTAQLSNENGSFASPINIGSVTSQSSGTISATIPSSGLVDGNGYRIRVVSSDPVFTGTDNGSDISIGSLELITSPGSQCKYGTDVTITVSASSSQSGIFRWYSDAAGTNLLQESISSETSSEYTVTISSNQTYYVEFESGGCSTPITPVSAYAIIPPTLNATAGGTFCEGSTVYLYSDGSGYDNLYWEGPNSFYSTDEDPVINNATASMSGIYTVYTNSLSGVNLVTNGDFEEGNTDFNSSYTYVTPTTNALWPEGVYTVVNDPNAVHDNFSSCGDHTTGSGQQMVINGATTAGVSVWSQTVNVVPNTYYQFTYWIQSVESNNPSELQLYINGVSAGPIYTADATTCSWKQFLYNWDSGSATTATLSLVNQNTIAGGNDFALDDIVFQHTCTAEASVDVTVGTGFTPDVTISADPGETICDGDLVTFTATPINGGTNPTYQWYLNGTVLTGETSDTYATNSITDGNNVSCEMTSNLACISGSATVTSNVITMNVVPPPTASAGANLTSCGTAVVITNDATASDYNNIEWTTSGTGVFSDASSLTACTYTPSAADITAGSVTLTLTAYGNTPCGNSVSTKTLTFVDPVDVSVATNNTNYCPQFLPPVSFNNDDDPRDPGYTEVGFTVTRNNTSAAWTIFTDFTVTAIPSLSGLSVENVVVTDEGDSPITVTGANQYNINASNNFVTIRAQVLNQPGHSLEIGLNVYDVEDANGCIETVTTNNDAIVDIYPMPAIGRFE